MTTFKNILRSTVFACLFAIPLVPLVVANSMFFPYITGKNFLFRILVEIAFFAWAALAFLDVKYRPRKSWLLVAFTLFTAVVAIADVFGENPAKSFWSNYERMEGLVTIIHLLMYFFVLSSALSEKLWRYIVYTSVGVATVISIMSLNQISGVGTRVDGTLGNSTYLGGYMLIHIFFIVYLMLRRVYEKVSLGVSDIALWSYGALALLFTYVLYATGTRGSLLGLLGGLVVLGGILAWKEREHRGLRKVSFGIIGAVIVIVASLASLRGTDFVKQYPLLERFSAIAAFDLSALKEYAQTQGFSRMTLWQMSWNGVKERPLLGWGQENFSYVFAKYYDQKMYGQEPWFDRTHNVFFDWLIATGFMGLLSYLSLFVVALWYLWRKDGFAVYEKALWTAVIVAYFIHNFFVFDNLTSYILIALVLVFVHLRVQTQSAVFSKQLEENKALVFAVVALVCLPVTLWAVNVPGYFANRNLLMSLAYAQESRVPSEATRGLVEKALSYNSFGNSEIREQVALIAPRYLTKDTSNEERYAWYSLTVEQMTRQLVETRDARAAIIFAGFYGRLGDMENAFKYLDIAETLFQTNQQLAS